MATIPNLLQENDDEIRNKTILDRIDNVKEADLHANIINSLQSDLEETDPNEASYVKGKSSLPVVLINGTIDIGDIGGTGTVNLPVTGDITSAINQKLGDGVSLITINFQNLGSSNYIMNSELISNIVSNNIDITPTVTRSRSATSLSFTIEEFSNISQDLSMLIQLVNFNGF